MYEDGYRNVTSVDISSIAVQQSVDRTKALDPPLRFLEMGITNLTFANETFDCVIDKGTLDALFTGPSHLVPIAMWESWRVLRPGGDFISITFGQPSKRKPLYEPSWAYQNVTRLRKRATGDDGGSAEYSPIYAYQMRKPRPGESPELATGDELERTSADD